MILIDIIRYHYQPKKRFTFSLKNKYESGVNSLWFCFEADNPDITITEDNTEPPEEGSDVLAYFGIKNPGQVSRD